MVIKSKRLERARHVAHMGETVCNIFIGKYEETLWET
jgi:hypothetical protein